MQATSQQAAVLYLWLVLLSVETGIDCSTETGFWVLSTEMIDDRRVFWHARAWREAAGISICNTQRGCCSTYAPQTSPKANKALVSSVSVFCRELRAKYNLKQILSKHHQHQSSRRRVHRPRRKPQHQNCTETMSCGGFRQTKA